MAQTGTSSIGAPTSAGGAVTAGLSPATGLTAGTPTNTPAGSPTAAATATPLGYTPATPDAMAASIVAMYRSGQSSLVLRLDPPGLGTVSVHVALGGNADVNVLFVPSVAQTGHLLQTGLGDLRQAMAASGLTLGQAQIGGGASGGTGGGTGAGTGGSNPGPQPGTTSRIAAGAAIQVEAALPENAIRGARAIA
jgi:flagellar hook-length control protein FliK